MPLVCICRGCSDIALLRELFARRGREHDEVVESKLDLLRGPRCRGRSCTKRCSGRSGADNDFEAKTLLIASSAFE